MSKRLLIETWLDPDPDDRITTHDLYCSAMEAMERIEELEAAVLREKRRVDSLHQCIDGLEAENKQLRLDAHTQQAFYGGRIEGLEAKNAKLRKAIQLEQKLCKNYYGEETAFLRDVLEYIKANTSCSVTRQWAKNALKVNTTVDDPAQESTNI